MRLEEYESEADAKCGRDKLVFGCENGHTVTVYSSDPYYPDWVDCPFCDCLMQCPPEVDSA